MSADFHSGANFARMLIGAGQGLTNAANNANLAGFQLASNSDKMKEAAKQAALELDQKEKHFKEKQAFDEKQKELDRLNRIKYAKTLAAPRWFVKDLDGVLNLSNGKVTYTTPRSVDLLNGQTVKAHDSNEYNNIRAFHERTRAAKEAHKNKSVMNAGL